MLKALVIYPNEKTRDIGDILQIARAEIRRRHSNKENPNVKALKFISELGVYVAVYERRCSNKPDVGE